MAGQGSPIGKRLEHARTQRVLTQTQLAEMAGVGLATVNRIERGHLVPQPTTIQKLAKALGVTPEWLKFGPNRHLGDVITGMFMEETGGAKGRRRA